MREQERERRREREKKGAGEQRCKLIDNEEGKERVGGRMKMEDG